LGDREAQSTGHVATAAYGSGSLLNLESSVYDDTGFWMVLATGAHALPRPVISHGVVSAVSHHNLPMKSQRYAGLLLATVLHVPAEPSTGTVMSDAPAFSAH